MSLSPSGMSIDTNRPRVHTTDSIIATSASGYGKAGLPRRCQSRSKRRGERRRAVTSSGSPRSGRARWDARGDEFKHFRCGRAQPSPAGSPGRVAQRAATFCQLRSLRGRDTHLRDRINERCTRIACNQGGLFA